MYPDYDDFYQEPSEYDEKVEEFKESLMKSVKQEWIDKMDKLEKENQELLEVKKNWNELKSKSESEIYSLKRECEQVKRDAEYNARNLRLKDLMKNLQQYYYRPNWDYMFNHKCDKCDEHKNIYFTSPSGKEMSEKCLCAESIRILSTETYVVHEFSLRGTQPAFWLSESINSSKDDCYYRNSEVLDDAHFIRDNGDFESIDLFGNYKTFFSTKELCEEYCNWYNKNALHVDVDSLMSKDELSSEEKREPSRRKRS